MAQHNEKQKLRVLEVIRQGQIGGGESHLLDLVAQMDRSRVEPVCLSFTDGEMVSRLHKMGVTCHVVESRRAFDPKVWSATARLVSDEHIDLIHAHGSRAASNVLYAARRTRRPLVYTVHGWSFHDDQNALVRLLRAESERLLCRCSHRVICVSQSNADTGRKMFGLSGATVIENGIDLQRFDPTRVEGDLRPALGFAPDDIVAAFIARCTAQKAPLDFLAAIEEAHRAEPRIKGLFVGEGDMDADVDRYIAQHHMEEYLCRTPFRTDVPQLLRAADLYVLPSLWEGLSIALLEAMAMEKTIVATPTDGTGELIADGHNGRIVPFRNPHRLAAVITEEAARPAQRKVYGEQARALVEQRFNARRVAQAVADIYDEVAAEGAPSSK